MHGSVKWGAMVEFGMGSAVRRKFCLWLQGGRFARGWGISVGERGGRVKRRLFKWGTGCWMGEGAQNRFNKKLLLFKHLCLWCSVLPVFPWVKLTLCGRNILSGVFAAPLDWSTGGWVRERKGRRAGWLNTGSAQPYGLIRPPCHCSSCLHQPPFE